MEVPEHVADGEGVDVLGPERRALRGHHAGRERAERGELGSGEVVPGAGVPLARQDEPAPERGGAG